MVTATLKMTAKIIRQFRTTPPLLNEEKNEGPTCRPMKKTNIINPKSRMKPRTVGLTLRPK